VLVVGADRGWLTAELALQARLDRQIPLQTWSPAMAM
jgi:hypothetical protein